MDRYDAALAKARAEYEKARKQGYTWLMNLLEGMFPELKESEDERIRRHLIDIVETYWGTTNDPGKAADLAWLERQKEQKPADKQFPPLEGLDAIKAKYYDDGFKNGFDEGVESVKPAEWSKEDEEMRINILQEIANIKDVFPKINIQPEFDWLKSLPERFNLQPKQEWSEDWREEDVQTRFAFYTYKDDPSVLYLSNVFVEESSRNHGFGTRIIRAAEKVAEIIGATTISLKVKQDSPANAWYRKNGYGYVAFEDGYDWLEKNLEYMKPNKQEWSEDDEKMRQRIIRHIESEYQDWCKDKYGNSEIVSDGKESCRERIAWLKSLRPSWKPSKDQMTMLLAVINDPNNAGAESCHLMLQSLYADLKKLS